MTLQGFTDPTRTWFESAFAAPTPAQVEGWKAISAGSHALIHAPTGSGKTLAAFLWAIDRLSIEPQPERDRRCRVLYVSPLKALAYDIERNLRAPLAGIGNQGAHEITVGMRTGDTSAADRRRLVRYPADILITTPESLYLMLTSQARETLRSVRWVIVDEIHSMAGSKRGVHLAVSLERLDELAEAPVQRIGLSATQRPLERIAEFLGGGEPDGSAWKARHVTIVDAPRDKRLETEIVVPLADMTNPGTVDAQGDPTRSIWPSVYPEILRLVEENRSTIVFSNSRGIVERIAKALNELAGRDIARAHHGSVSREQRIEIEDGLKTGRLRCVVATSSLELGIDMDAVDRVILVESPTTVARGLQRVGRAGHQVGAPSKATVFPKHRGDLLEATLVVDRMHRGLIEETRVPENPLDVLAQQIVSCVAAEDRSDEMLFDLVRRAYPFRSLGREAFDAVLDMLSGRYPSDDFAEFRARVSWDRVTGELSARSNARLLAVTNAGTIPDRGLYPVVLPEGDRVGELDEEMVYESRVGDVFILGSSTWKVLEIGVDRVVVAPAPGERAGRLPFWHGDRLGRPVETGRALGEFVRTIGELQPADAKRRLIQSHGLDEWAADNLVSYVAEERQATGALPTDRTIVVERFRDELGDWRLVILSPFGARVHAPWAMAIQRLHRERSGFDAEAVWSDDGVIVRFPDADRAPDPDLVAIDPEDVDSVIIDELGESPLFAGRFREAAARSLLLPRRRPGRRTPLWLQRRKSTSLLEAARRFPSFPIVLETYREILKEHFDVPALKALLTDIRSRKVRVAATDVARPSPFATSLSFDFVASFLYEYDAPPAERRAMALTIDEALLRQLLGEPELRDLLDSESVAAVEADLQSLSKERRVAGAEQIHDMLRRLGPLSNDEIEARTTEPPGRALDLLTSGTRIIEVNVAGAAKWSAVEDASRLRDGLGVVLPKGIPEAFLEPVADPMGDLVSRFARTHGPFTEAEVATALGVPIGAVSASLRALEDRDRVVRGAFRPDGLEREWVGADVLRRLKRRSLAALRQELEPSDPATFARFCAEWHGIGSRGSRLFDVVHQLQGVAIPASILEADVLPARLDYTPDMLDALTASGEVVWVGRSPLGTRDGRIALYTREQVRHLLWEGAGEAPDRPIHVAIRNHLAARGASFFTDVYQSAGGGDPEAVLQALWDLVWSGEVTNDTLAPLRAFLWGRVRSRPGRPSLPRASGPPSGSGRWYLTSDLLDSATDTETAAVRAQQLLERHGIVVRDAVLAEGVPGGFAGLYPVLNSLDEAGRARRGYFVSGLGGIQFALPGALDRLRGVTEDPRAVAIAAADPANPYGSTLPWPDHSGRPSRSAGAYVVVVGGDLTAFVDRGGKTVLSFADDRLDTTASVIADLAKRGARRLAISTVDGQPAAKTPLGNALAEAGFTEGYRGLALRT